MKSRAVIIYGPPGAGKGTQANLLAWKYGFFHFDSGKYVRSVTSDPANKNNKRVQQEKKKAEAGILMSPSWILSIFLKEMRKIAKVKMTIVYSGSPRTMFEAYGSEKRPGLVQELIKEYGRKNIIFFYLKITPEVAAKRNTIRKTCAVCATSLLGKSKQSECPICSGSLITRADDSNPEVIKKRIEEYNTRTLPVIDKARKMNLTVKEIDAELPPYEVFTRIEKELNR
ncbi:MAG: hypothetical protein COU06_00470 [Candidatus Harrisonbacteria bacterium CG10_big_fil_rev_8_21_14_0_10_38_8]|uniref:Adenylate kinase n=1 Tax=Candidatus Harrisonbacteria bacterium CG10_big_fil_rev_8_21_14_0_10_38_8 TaxID=1974582 RepID=A0A2M6WKM9_9BACT|nr:MAG: hypothetical protein COU06_00470 [Candidatus Harrisonbacteria bacterium CG10_big_fil_rev_8_21_14_0_10_38_8]